MDDFSSGDLIHIILFVCNIKKFLVHENVIRSYIILLWFCENVMHFGELYQQFAENYRNFYTISVKCITVLMKLVNYDIMLVNVDGFCHNFVMM